MQFAQQVDFRLFGFFARQILAYGVLLALFGRAGLTDVVQLDDVPAELRAYGRADLAGFELVDGFFKGRDHHAVGEPTQITAAVRAAVLRILARQTGEVCAAAGLCIDCLLYTSPSPRD